VIALSRSTAHLMFRRWQSPALLAMLALRLAVKSEPPQLQLGQKRAEGKEKAD
jgi:hypothetical protein